MDNINLQQTYGQYLFEVVRGFNYEHARFVQSLQQFKRGQSLTAQEVDVNVQVINSLYHYATVANNLVNSLDVQDVLKQELTKAYNDMVNNKDAVVPLRIINDFALALNKNLVYVMEHPTQARNETVQSLVDHGV